MYSVEDLIAVGTGRVSREQADTHINNKLLKSDGYTDSIFIDMSRAQEDLEFMDSYQAVCRKNNADKIRMLRKIKMNYGVRSYVNNTTAAASVESFCNRNMTSMEENKEATDGKEPDTRKWYIKVLDAIKRFFKAIGRGFAHIGKVIKKFFTGEYFKKAKNNAGGDNAPVIDPDTVTDEQEKAEAEANDGDNQAPPKDSAKSVFGAFSQAYKDICSKTGGQIREESYLKLEDIKKKMDQAISTYTTKNKMAWFFNIYTLKNLKEFCRKVKFKDIERMLGVLNKYGPELTKSIDKASRNIEKVQGLLEEKDTRPIIGNKKARAQLKAAQSYVRMLSACQSELNKLIAYAKNAVDIGVKLRKNTNKNKLDVDPNNGTDQTIKEVGEYTKKTLGFYLDLTRFDPDIFRDVLNTIHLMEFQAFDMSDDADEAHNRMTTTKSSYNGATQFIPGAMQGSRL